MRRKKEHLVCQHLEKISKSALDKYQDVLKKLVKGRHGIYALYSKNRLCYVGLASNLHGRIKHHLKDRHAGGWDRFSVYLTIKSDQLRELEALALRIASPKENRQKGKLTKSQNLKRLLTKMVRQKHRREIQELFGGGTEAIDADTLSEITEGRKPALAGYFSRGQKIRWDFKGKMYHAYVKKNGTIRFRKKIYNSPSLAAKSIGKGAKNGWRCWTYERAPGDWVPLNELRK